MKNWKISLAALSSLTLLSAHFAMAARQKAVAQADILNAKGETIGHADFYPEKSGVKLHVKIRGLAAGENGIHIHDKGVCTAPDFKSAGGHLNPEGKHHGLENPQGHHEGDLPNLKVGEDGTADQVFHIKGATVEGDAPTSLFKADGTALVIHAKQDDQKSDPAGNAGDRIACGVIKKTDQTP